MVKMLKVVALGSIWLLGKLKWQFLFVTFCGFMDLCSACVVCLVTLCVCVCERKCLNC
jgi:hypothetical protein